MTQEQIIQKEYYTNILLDTFKDLLFEENSHSYYLGDKSKKLKYSVSGLIKKITPVFDAEKKATELGRVGDKSKEQLLKEWAEKRDNACDLGHNTHLFGENYMFNRTLKPETKFEEAVVNFWSSLPDFIIPIFPELKMYCKKRLFAGTADIILYNIITKKFIIGDYKGLPLKTKILTDKGWSTMGTIKKGDKVFDKNGEICSVINTSEIKNVKCYKIKFDNNEEIVSDFEHRWEISFINGKVKKDVVMTTEEIKQYLNTSKKLQSYKQIRLYNPKPLNNEKKELLIDPYVLGVWLGDGHSADTKITQQNELVWNEIEKRGYNLGKDVSQGGAGKAQTRTILGIHSIFKKLNLLKNKHIPVEYLLSSYEQRLDLLRGFMDADGYYNKKRKRFVITTTKESQINFMIPLLGSLGIKSTIIKAKKYCNGKIIEGYDLCFTTTINPFLCRNFNLNIKTNELHKYRKIISVEEVESEPTRCIEVDSSTHTFLYGDSMIVTHNTNEDLFKNFKGETLLGDFTDLLNNNFNKYQIQLSFYEYLFNQTGLEVSYRKIIHLKPDGTFIVYDTQNLMDRIIKFVA